MACPVKNDDWKRLVKYVGSEDQAYRVFRAHGSKVPKIPRITEIKGDIAFQNVIYSERKRAMLNLAVDNYNRKNNTSHSLSYKPNTPSSEKVFLTLNFMPKSVSIVVPKSSNLTTAKSGDVKVETPDSYNKIFVQGANQYVVNGNVFPSYGDAENYIAESNISKYGVNLMQSHKIKGGSISDVLDQIIEKSNWKYGKLLAKRFKSYNSDASIEILDNDSFIMEYNDYLRRNKTKGNPSGANGVYLPSDNRILVRGSSTEKTILHEIAHAMSIPVLSNEASAIGMDFKLYFEQIKRKLIDSGVDPNTYGLKNEREFISEVMTNTRFISILKAYPPIVKSNSRNAWTELMDFFKKIFGIKADSLLDEAIEKVIEVFDEQNVMNHVSYIDVDPTAFESQLEGIEALKDKLNKTSQKLLHKSKILSKSSGKYDADAAFKLKNIPERIRIKVEAGEYAKAILDTLEQLINTELEFYTDNINNYLEGKPTTVPMDSSYINKMDSAAKLYRSVASDLIGVLSMHMKNPELKPIYAEVQDTLRNFNAQLDHIQNHVKGLTRGNAIKLIKDILGDNLETAPEEILDSISTDISQFNTWFGAMANSPDAIMRAIYKMVVFQHMDTQRAAQKVGKDLFDLQLELENAGHKDMSVYHERYEGKKTGYLISPVNWGEYDIERKRMYDNLMKEMSQFGYNTFADIPNKKELPKEQREIFDKYYNVFTDKYMRFDQYTRSLVPNPPINPEFRNIKNNSDLFKYYVAFKNTMNDARKLLPKQYRGSIKAELLLPQIRRDLMEVIKSKDEVFKSIGVRIKEQFISTDQDVDLGLESVIQDQDGNPVRLVPVHYATKIENTNDLSDDMTSMATAFYEMAHKFNGNTKKLADINILQRSLEDRQFSRGKKGGKFAQSQMNKMLENFKDAQIFNIKDNNIEYKIPGTETSINVTKTMNSLLDFVRKNNLFASISAVSGSVKARADLVSDEVSSKYTSVESAKWARGELTRNVASLIENIGKRKKSGKVNLLFEYNGIYGDVNEQFSRMNMRDRASRIKSSDITYLSFMLGEAWPRGKFALSVYNNYRLVDGKFITKRQFERIYGNKTSDRYDESKKWKDFKNDTLYNAYEVKDDRFVVKPEYKEYVSSDLENEVRYTIETRYATISGQLTPYDRPAIARTIMGRFLMLHRNWMPSGATERFKKTVRDGITGEIDEGYYRSAWNFLGRFLSEKGNLNQKIAVWGTLQDYEKHNVVKTLMDVSIAISFVILSNILQGLAEDEPDEYWMQFLAYTMNRIRLEQTAFFSPKEAISMLNSPTAAGNLVKTLGSTVQLLTDWEKIEYGAYEDMYHLQKAVIKNSRLKNIWEMRNADAVGGRNKFLTTQIL